MITSDKIADEVLKFVCNRVNVTLGTRLEIRRFVAEQVDPFLPRAQSSLNFDVCAGKHQGNRQSVKAAKEGESRRPSQRQRIWTWLHERGEVGGTVEEIADALSMRYTSVSARCAELKRDGLVKESGKTRQTETQSDAAVLVVA